MMGVGWARISHAKIHARQSSLPSVIAFATLRCRYMTASCSAVFAAARFASFHLHATCLSTSDGTLCSTGCASLSISVHQIASLAPHPCPRRPSPDTASTSALAQGQQEGDKRRVRAQSQACAQVPDADPTPSTTLREPDNHSIVEFLSALLFWYPLPVTSHLLSLHEYGRGRTVCFLRWPLSLGNP